MAPLLPKAEAAGAASPGSRSRSTASATPWRVSASTSSAAGRAWWCALPAGKAEASTAGGPSPSSGSAGPLGSGERRPIGDQLFFFDPTFMAFVPFFLLVVPCLVVFVPVFLTIRSLHLFLQSSELLTAHVG